MLRILRSAFAAFGLVFASTTAASAIDGHWQPPNIGPTAATLPEVLASRDRARGKGAGDSDQRIERWTIRTAGDTLATLVSVRNENLRFDTTIGGVTYSEGRADDARWRRTPNGLVRQIGADVQGDQLDRWPLALFPYAVTDCRLLGVTTDDPRRYVVEYRPAHDSPHWFFYDASSGALTNETVREGSRTYTFTFSDSRTTGGATRPFAWHTGGWGGDEDVTVDDVEPRDVPAASVALPASNSEELATFEGPSVRLPAHFDDARNRIYVDGAVNGHRARFIFDTGTTQILIDAAAARRFGIQTVLGHGIAGDVSTGPVQFKDLAIETTSLDRFGADGIVGYDYFAGHIVHLDYGRERVTFERRDTFTAPPGAYEMDANYNEGMPLAPATIGGLTSRRIALDTGSYGILFLRALYAGRNLTPTQLGFSGFGNVSEIGFLEGAITIQAATVASVTFAGATFKDSAVSLEIQNPSDAVDFPIDGIFGTGLLARYEWWFDYDGGHCWLRYI
jgi:hypothetical protein